MTFRTRVLLAFAPVVLVPLVVFGVGVRRVVSERLTAQYERRVETMAAVIRDDLARASAAIGARLGALREALLDDNRLRVAVVQGALAERGYLLDYAGGAMRLAGLDLLQLQDETGRILSSGHFRNEFDRLDPVLPRGLGGLAEGTALVRARTAEAPLLALARVDSVLLGGRRFTLVGGLAVDGLLAGLARDPELRVTLVTPDDTAGRASAAEAVVTEISLPYVAAGPAPASARLVLSHSLESLADLRRATDFWFLAAVLGSAAVALVVGGWLASRVSRPLTDLADRTAAVDMDRLDVRFDAGRDDEVGVLAGVLGEMTARLRAGAARLREFERRAAMGDLARQVNHDIKNGLAPIRNVFRHLTQVARERPADTAQVLTERQGTVESSISYLEGLAANYARLSPETGAGPVDVNAVVREALRHVTAPAGARVALELTEDVPRVKGDALVLRRILENLVGNAVDALEAGPGTVTVSTERVDGAVPGVRLVVADTGKGMSRAELDRAFDDFYTTKPGGTGLGLSITRRLVLDLNGRLRVETAPDEGTRFIIEFPAPG